MAIETRDQKVQNLKDEILVLASMVEQMVRYSIDALINRRPEDSEKVYTYDQEINQKHAQIEGQCLSLIATEPPILAADLRLLASILEVNTEIERIGDAAKKIAKLNITICNQPPIDGQIRISSISDQILENYFQAIGAFIAEDIETAKKITSENNEIEEKFELYKGDIIERMKDQTPTANNIAEYLRITHYLIEIYSHIINICNRTFYLTTGKLPINKYLLQQI